MIFALYILTNVYVRMVFGTMRFEDLVVWRKSAKLCSDIYILFNDHPDFVFKNQITRSALSISSNIAEGFERESDKECLRFLIYSKGSCGELRSQIYIGMKINYINDPVGKEWLNRANEISNMLAGLIKTKQKFIKLKQTK